MAAGARRNAGRTAVVVAALGVVFGDIGTSPIYTIQTAFNPGDPHPIQTSLQSVYGVVSLIFWAVTLIVTVKYVGLVMKADNDGEGGIMALISQVRQIGAGVEGRTKFLHGAWVPLLIGIALFTVMTTWFRGRRLVGAERKRVEGPLQAFVDELRRLDPPLIRGPGTGVFMSRGKETTPLSMHACVDHLHSLQEHAIILSLQSLPSPRINPEDRLEIDDLRYKDDGITFVRAKYGYAEHYDVPALVRQVTRAGGEHPIDTGHTSFYLSTVELRAGHGPGMRRWRKRLFLATGLAAAEPADYLRLPPERTITIGSEIEL